MSKTIEPHILKQYSVVRQLGSGAYGHVWQVTDKKSNAPYALKKAFDAFRNSIDAQRTYRQIEVLHQLRHANIIKLHRVIKAKNNKDLYMVFEYMEADLHSVVGTNILQKTHQIYVFHQILKGIKYVHSAELIHRDLKPSNILINSECVAKLCDFGLIRSLASQENQQIVLSEQVATKWYRAPQLLLGSRSYGKPVDMWSFGCIVAEILTGRALFAGNSTLNQLEKILQFIGDIHKTDIDSLESPVADQLISQIRIRKRSFRDYFGGIDPDFHQLLKGIMQFNPHKRLTVDEALQLPLFRQFRQEQLKICLKPIVPVVDDNIRLGMKAYREKIYEDIQIRYHQEEKQTRIKRRPLTMIQAGRPNSLSKQKNRSSSKQKSLSKKSLPDKKLISTHSSTNIKKKTSTSPYSPKVVAKNQNFMIQDVNPIKRYQVKSPTNKIVKKTSKKKLIEGEKKEILKALGFEKTKNLYRYMC